MKKCKITVLKRTFQKELADQYIADPCFGPCDLLQEGDVFVTGGPYGRDMPEGFCPDAWDAIGKIATALAWGGKAYNTYETFISSCNDGCRPVIFKMEVIEEP